MVFPSVMVAIVLVVRRSSDAPIRFTGSWGVLVNCAVLVASSPPRTRVEQPRSSTGPPCWWTLGVAAAIAEVPPWFWPEDRAMAGEPPRYPAGSARSESTGDDSSVAGASGVSSGLKDHSSCRPVPVW